jgi:hypothetical protein
MLKLGIGIDKTQKRFVTGASYQPETLSYLNALPIVNNSTLYFIGTPQEITGAAIWNAVDSFVVTLKTNFSLTLGINNLNTKCPAIYPFIGGTAITNKYNLCDAQDTNAAYRIIWSGGVTHSSTGVAFNGTNGYGNTFINQNVKFGVNYYGFSYAINSYTTGVLMGSRDGSAADFDYSEINGVSLNDSFKTITGGVSTAITSLYRIISTQIKYIRNGSTQTLTSNYGASPNNAVYIGAYDSLGTPILYSNANLKTYTIISQPTDANITALQTAISTLNTNLLR